MYRVWKQKASRNGKTNTTKETNQEMISGDFI